MSDFPKFQLSPRQQHLCSLDMQWRRAEVTFPLPPSTDAARIKMAVEAMAPDGLFSAYTISMSPAAKARNLAV